ncbi:MAG TPA: PepSY-associated TM helix domain-containing protein [Candidatus Sulfotelmatobacter sp.]|nr:PepSY-associated TM helix domain-containing protein [Candidatus Sulfotelmatobacter sp.]
MRKVILNVHLFIALTAGAFMVILGSTGSIMEFEPELDQLLRSRLSYVTPGQRVLSLTEIGDAVSRKFGGEPVVAYVPSLSPNLSWQVVLPRGIAYVNQYTGEVLGVRVRGQTFLGYVRALHVRLAGGDLGRDILKWSGIGMLLSLASGLYLWWPIKRVRIRGKWGSRRLWFDLHNAVGIFMLLPLTVLAATGTVLGFEDQFAPLIYKMTRSSPTQSFRSPTRKLEEGATPITPDEAVAAAILQMPGAVPYRVQMPRYGGIYQVALLDPQDRVTGDRNVVGLDPYGNLVSLIRSSDLSRGARVLALSEAIHTGNVLGMPSRIVVWLASTMVFLQAASGLLMWLYRRKLSGGQSRGEGGP